MYILYMKPICRICKAEVEPGTLLTHERTHPKTAPVVAKARVCYRVRCVEVYGPKGHLPGVEGACAYGGR